MHIAKFDVKSTFHLEKHSFPLIKIYVKTGKCTVKQNFTWNVDFPFETQFPLPKDVKTGKCTV